MSYIQQIHSVLFLNIATVLDFNLLYICVYVYVYTVWYWKFQIKDSIWRPTTLNWCFAPTQIQNPEREWGPSTQTTSKKEQSSASPKTLSNRRAVRLWFFTYWIGITRPLSKNWFLSKIYGTIPIFNLKWIVIDSCLCRQTTNNTHRINI